MEKQHFKDLHCIAWWFQLTLSSQKVKVVSVPHQPVSVHLYEVIVDETVTLVTMDWNYKTAIQLLLLIYL